MPNLQQATLAGGCFWCTEAIFKRIKGVEKVVSGYAGNGENPPSYDQVSSGATTFAEAIQLDFDPSAITYDKILEVFFATHDPTTMNRQGNDVGSQYRSEIFYHDDGQKASAEKAIADLNASGRFKDPLVTTLEPYSHFFSAEDYHLDFYDRNRNYPYCQVIIDPKIKKLYKEFPSELKPEYKNAE